jgi:FkbM family methyltransferase
MSDQVTSIHTPPTTPNRRFRPHQTSDSSRRRWTGRRMLGLLLASAFLIFSWIRFRQTQFAIPEKFETNKDLSISLQESSDVFAEELVQKLEAASTRSIVYLGDYTLLCYVSHIGRHLFLDSRDRGITPHLCTGKGWESETTMAIQRLVQPGMNVIDVGSNIGWFTFVVSNAVGRQGRVLAVEANPSTFRLISWSAEIAGFNQGWNRPNRQPKPIAQGDIAVVNHAAFDEDNASLRITADPYRSLNNHLSENGKDPASTSVQGITIATLTQTYLEGKVDLIKIDVEGVEDVAYKGLRPLIMSNPQLMVVIEVNTKRFKDKNVDPKPFYEMLFKDFNSVKVIGERGHLYGVSEDELMQSEFDGEDRMLVLQNHND